MSTHNLCFKQKYEKISDFFLSESFHFSVVKFSVYLNRHVFITCIVQLISSIMVKIYYTRENKEVDLPAHLCCLIS